MFIFDSSSKCIAMKNFILGLFTLLFIHSSASAQFCSENTNVNGIAGTSFSNGIIGQSFTACETGRLRSVSVESGNSGSGFNNVVVEIRNGDGFNGTLLATSVAVNVKSNRTTTWDMTSHNIPIVSGQKYTARFITQSGTPQMAYSSSANPANDYYPGGKIHGAGQAHNDMFFTAKVDYITRTLNPADESVEVSRNTNVQVDFSRNMEAVSGDITIENITDATTESIDVTTLTIDGGTVFMPLANPLLPGKEYSIVIPAGVLQTTDGFTSSGISSGDWNFTTTTRPYATLSTAVGDIDNESVMPFTIEFSDVVTGFELSDLVITNGTASNISGSDNQFSFDVTPSADGEVVVSLPENVVEAGASNGNEATDYQLEYDGTAPEVELTTEAAGTIETSVFDMEVVFSEPVVGFESSDLIISNAVVLSMIDVDDSLFTVSLQAQAEGQITIDLGADIAEDLAGNTNNAAPAIIDLTYSVDLESDLISYYPFNGNAEDTVSNGINGTVSGTTLTTGYDGTADGAYNFDGGDFITFGDTPIGAGSFTIALWVKIPEGLPQNQLRTIIAKRASCGEGRFFEINYNNSSTDGHRISVEQRNNASVSSPIALLDGVGEWMHLAYVKDNDELESSFYINGVQQTPVGWTSTYNFENNGDLRAGISACDGGGRFKFNGDMDEIYVYGRALTAVEIDLLVPFILRSSSIEAGSQITAGESIDFTFNKELVASSVNSTNITATGSASGALDIDITLTENEINVMPTSGWPIGEDVTITLSGLLAVNGMTLETTSSTYTIIAEEDAGMILHYPISGNVNEALGNIPNQDGTITGALFTEGVDGDAFGALSFDGTDDVVTLGDAPLSTGSFSMSFWVKVPTDGSTTANTIILSKREACTDGKMFDVFYRREGDKCRFVTGMRSNANVGGVTTGYDFELDEWHKVTFVKDNVARQNRMFVNGVLEGQRDWLINNPDVENATEIKLGATPCNGVDGTQRFDGVLDDYRIYDQVISPLVTSIIPVRGTTNVETDAGISITFSKALDAGVIGETMFSISDEAENTYPFTLEITNGDSVVTLTPNVDLPKGKKITVSVDGLPAFFGSDFLPFQTSFTTVPTKLTSFSPVNNSSEVDSLASIALKFDNGIDESSIEAGIQVIGTMSGPVSGSFSMVGTDSIRFEPSSPYFANEVISVILTPELRDIGDESLAGKAMTFRVASSQFTNATLSFELSQLTTSFSVAMPRDLVPADLDNDGDLDLVGSDESSRKLFWFENRGFGSFSEEVDIAGGNDHFDIEVTDFDYDGDMDIVTVSRVFNRGVYWYENDGTASFTQHTIIAHSSTSDLRAVETGDFDNDGVMDVAVVNFGQNNLSVYDQQGSTLYATSSSGGPLDVQAADADNDGDLDLFQASYTTGVVSAYYNNGIGTSFSNLSFLSISQPRALIPIDFDNDGDLDIVYSAQAGSAIGVLENNGNFSYTNHQVGSVGGPHRIDVGDVDGDGDYDIIYTVAGGASEINFYYLENSGAFELWVPSKLIESESFSGTFTQTAKLADIDNDGDLDVVATDAASGFYIFENKIIDLNNGPQVENPIADQTVEEDSEGLTIDVTGVFVDAEGDDFTLTASSDNENVTVAIAEGDLEVEIAADFFGTVNITVTADDGNGINNDVFVLEVTPVNDPPVFTLSTTSLTLDEDFTTTETVTITLNQPDNEDLPTYSLASAIFEIINVQIDSNTGELTITSEDNAFGTAEITVIADDGASENNLTEQTLTVVVNPVNDAPVIANPIPDISFDEDPANNQIIIITHAFSDADGETLDISLEITSGAELASVTLVEDEIVVEAVSNAYGALHVEVTAADEAGASITDDFNIDINPVNDAPSFTLSGDLTLNKNFEGTETVTVNADPIPFGEDNQVVTYSLEPATVQFCYDILRCNNRNRVG